MEILKIENLTKSYGKKRALDHLNLSVEKGEFFGFIGPNGAGKSTAIRSVLGLILPNEGVVQVFGQDTRQHTQKILSRIGFMPSQSFFYPGMRVKELLKLSASLYRKDCSAKAASLCRRLQLDPEAKIRTLSLGNRKKLAILCALQHEPDLLILDEPSSGLDPLIQKEFFAILKEMNEQGTTVFFSSHNLNEVNRCCSRAAILNQGKLAACGSLRELQGTAARIVQFTGCADLSGLEGIRSVKQEKDRTSFVYEGPLSSLLIVLSQASIEDLTIRQPELEEIFLHYYQKGEEES